MTSQQVDASTVDAATLFGNNRFSVPDFQRKYSWRVDDEVADFWQDLSRAIDTGDDYFLGLLVTTNGAGRREVVDGQQRLITLSLLANAVRLIAVSHDRQLVAETLRTTFLFSIDYKTEKQLPRVELTDPADAEAFAAVISAATQQLLPTNGSSRVIENHAYLFAQVTDDVGAAASPDLRIGQWAEFISYALRFAVFDHPDRAAAFRVYEVINARGKVLTPAELIKSYAIGTSADRAAAYDRWQTIEQQFEDISAGDQLTTFVRHVVALRRGYVIPRELYQVVTRTYRDADGVERLLDDLHEHLPVYQQLIDPSADVEASEERTRAFAILGALSATRFRPIVLAAVASGEAVNLQRILEIVVPGLIAGRFSTGSIEAQFARAARRVHQGEAEWGPTLVTLKELMPSREEFELRLQRGVPKPQAQVLRSALIQSSRSPDLNGHPHQVRPRNGESWPAFDSEDYREVGSTLANWVLLNTERRPQGTRTPEAVRERLLKDVVAGEKVRPEDADRWTADFVRSANETLADGCGALWYDA